MPAESPTVQLRDIEFSSRVLVEPNLEEPREIADKCAVFGIYSNDGSSVAEATALGLFALQHRGQESSGVTSSDGQMIFDHRRAGLVSQVYDETIFDFNTLPGHIAIGHNRYGTSKKKKAPNAHVQPTVGEIRTFTLGHNGNLPDTTRLEDFLREKGIRNPEDNDTEMMHAAIGYHVNRGANLENAIVEAIPLFTGVFSLLAMDKDKIVAARDTRGIRPLSIGSLNGSHIISSETAGFDIIGAKNERDVAPGEMVIIDQNGIRSYQYAPGEQRLDVFELVYFARPDSNLLGRNVYQVRENFGRILAQEHPIKADIIVPVPYTAVPAAIGYHDVSGIPYKEGIVKNRYVGRTFITPGSERRSNDVEKKLHPVPEVVGGQRVIVLDDSIVRGTTSRKIVQLVRDAGAREVHLMITSPPMPFPDFYGIDTPRQGELLAASRNIEQMREFIGADSLGFLSRAGMIRATGLPESVLSTSSFTGEYPIDIGQRKEEIVYDSSWKNY